MSRPISRRAWPASLLLVLLAGCQSNPPSQTNVTINQAPAAGGCDAACQAVQTQYQEAAEDCRRGNQAACARKARLGARMNAM